MLSIVMPVQTILPQKLQLFGGEIEMLASNIGVVLMIIFLQ